MRTSDFSALVLRLSQSVWSEREHAVIEERMGGWTVTPEQERWAFADKLMQIHEDDVGIYIAERINMLSAAGDEDGARFWIDISFKVVSLAGPEDDAWTQ